MAERTKAVCCFKFKPSSEEKLGFFAVRPDEFHQRTAEAVSPSQGNQLPQRVRARVTLQKNAGQTQHREQICIISMKGNGPAGEADPAQGKQTARVQIFTLEGHHGVGNLVKKEYGISSTPCLVK